MSGRKNSIPPYPILSAVSMASNQTSATTNIENFDNVGIQLVWTGSNPIGTITINVSQDGTNWTPLQTSPGSNLSISPGGAAGNAFVDYQNSGAAYIQVAYATAASSVGNLTATIMAKMI